jgi:hypothetical protein
VPNRIGRELGLILGWLVFPLLPVVSEELTAYPGNRSDPHAWGWLDWIITLGPLVGYGFLAGATMTVPDEVAAPARGVRRLLGRRALWVAIGPWWGAYVCLGLFFGLLYLDQLFPGLLGRLPGIPESWKSTWAYWLADWTLSILAVAMWAYSWLLIAWFALRRAARARLWKQSLLRGIMIAAAFVGSLFGSFWAATTVWRSYFFDPRIVRLLVLTATVAVVSGCSSTVTYGEIRRRELFHAMLVAWLLGLAIMWRWWSRVRPGKPPTTSGSG